MLVVGIRGLWTVDCGLLADTGVDCGAKHSISKSNITSLILFLAIAKLRPENCRNVDSSDFTKVLMESFRFSTFG